MEKKPVTIEINRPTGPRVIAGPPRQQGYLERYVPRQFRLKQGAIAVASIVSRPKVVAAGSTIALAVVAHLTVSSLSQFVAMPFWSFSASNKAAMDPQPAGGSYTGLGDGVFTTSPLGFYSCAQAWSAAYAAGAGNACDLVDSAAPTTVICTLKFTSTGKVDLASASCTGSVTPATKCAAATGGVCNISQVYDQTGTGNHMTQATAASQPTLLFSSTPTSTLPAINCGTIASNVLVASANITQAQPFTMNAVIIRKADFTTAGGAFGSSIGSGVRGIGSFNTANNLEAHFGNDAAASGTDNVWHAVTGLANGASGATNVDGTDATLNNGTNAISAQPIRLCRGFGNPFSGLIAEAAIWGATTNSTNRNAISANQHSSGRYNF